MWNVTQQPQTEENAVLSKGERQAFWSYLRKTTNSNKNQKSWMDSSSNEQRS